MASQRKHDPDEVKRGEEKPLLKQRSEVIDSIKKKMEDPLNKVHARGPSECIYKVPEKLRKVKESAYTPLVVSIGPIHKRDERLKGMEKYKLSYMHSLFRQQNKSDEVGEECVDAMLKMVTRARSCYAVRFDHVISDVEFAEMMLVDGCFILELLLRSVFQLREKKKSDSLISNSLVLNDIRNDLVLLENQIPFFILQKLFHLTVEQIENPLLLRFLDRYPRRPLTWLILMFFGNMLNPKREIKNKNVACLHILDFLYKCYFPGDQQDVNFEATAGEDRDDIDHHDINLEASEGENQVKIDEIPPENHHNINLGTIEEINPASGLSSRCFNYITSCWLEDHDHIKVEDQDENDAVVHGDGVSSRCFNYISSCWFKCISRDVTSSMPEDQTIHKYTATELGRAGVKFKVSKKKVLDANFNTSCWFSCLGGDRTPSKSPTFCIYNPTRSTCCLISWLTNSCGRVRFTITPICIYDNTEPFLRNLIAFEQCSPSVEGHFTSYAFLMDTLINTKEDVELLQKAGVVQNYLGSSEEVSDLFNGICKEVVLKESSFFQQWQQVHQYRKHYCPRHLASLRANYFSSPWTIISVIAALMLFALTVTQTIFTIRSSR